MSKLILMFKLPIPDVQIADTDVQIVDCDVQVTDNDIQIVDFDVQIADLHVDHQQCGIDSIETYDGQVKKYQVNGVSQLWQASVLINGTPCDFKIDTGADVSIISEEIFKGLKVKPKLKQSSVVLSTPGGNLKHSGQFIARTQLGGKVFHHRVFVVKEISNNLLCGSTATRLGLVQRLFEVAHDSEFGKLDCNPVSIRLIADAEPYSVFTPRRVPVHILPKVEQELNRLEQHGITMKITEPTEWCSPMVPVVKKNGEIRICADFNKLNKYILRERFIMPTIEEMLPKLAGSTKFSKLDAHSGFYQIPLDEASYKLTTFITPLGRYCFKRVPFGISSAPEIFQRTMSDLFRGIDGVIVLMDDILVFGVDDREHDKRLSKVMDMIKTAGLKLNEAKCLFKQSQVEFFGHILSGDGISPSMDKVKAILDMKPPTDTTGVRMFMGMINYLGRFLPDLSQVAKPLNELMCADKAWCWDKAQNDAFNNIKNLISQAPVLAFYDVKKPTVVSADASSYGIGGVILQEHPSGLKPVAFYSRSLSMAERKYAQIEKECLAGVCACERFAMYLVGLQSFRLLTDHKPLVPLINNRDIDQTPIRCQRLLMRMMRFNAQAEHTPGKNLVIADTLSRNPVGVGINMIDELEDDVEAYVGAVTSAWPSSEDKLAQIRVETQNDGVLKQVLFYTTAGWPQNFKEVTPNIGPYFNDRGALSVVDGLLVHGCRIVIPESMRDEVLHRIHEGHQGMVKCAARAKSSVWWPGITVEIQRLVQQCSKCQTDRCTQRKEPLMSTPTPSRPWAKVAADFAEYKGQKYLVLVCYYSKYIEIAHMVNTTAFSVVNKLKSIFARFGCPEELVTDNGPPFGSGEFKDFVKFFDIKHTTSSPHYPQSNGQVERAVQVAKHILNQDDPFLALMAYRSTPHSSTGFSPAQVLLGRQMRTRVPVLTRSLLPDPPDHLLVVGNDERAKETQAKYYNQRNGVRPLLDLKQGDRVRIKLDKETTWSEPNVVRATQGPRSFLVEDPRGHILRRTRHHLQLIPNSSPHGQEPERLQPRDNPSPPQAQNSPRKTIQSNPSPRVPNFPVSSPNPKILGPQMSSSIIPSPQNPDPKRSRFGRVIKVPDMLNL